MAKIPKLEYSDKEVDGLIKGMFDGSITQYNIPENLYNAIAENLKKAIYEGFGGGLADFEGKDLELLQQLRDNVYMFSAAKSFTELKDMSSLLTSGDKVLSFKEFKEVAKERYDVYNESYLATEYTTAMGQAQSASKWNEIEKNKESLPLLEYSTVGDACDICAPLDGLTAPVDDDIWDEVAPLNHFNCECILLQKDEEDGVLTADSEKDEIFDKVTGRMDDVFKSNPGKTGEVFNPDHPYFDVDKKDKEFAKENFGLPIPSDDE